MKDEKEDFNEGAHLEIMMEMVNSTASLAIHFIKSSQDKKVIGDAASLITFASSIAEIEVMIVRLMERRTIMWEELKKLRKSLTGQDLDDEEPMVH